MPLHSRKSNYTTVIQWLHSAHVVRFYFGNETHQLPNIENHFRGASRTSCIGYFLYVLANLALAAFIVVMPAPVAGVTLCSRGFRSFRGFCYFCTHENNCLK